MEILMKAKPTSSKENSTQNYSKDIELHLRHDNKTDFNYNNCPNNIYEKYGSKDFSISPAPPMFDEFLSNFTEYQEH